MGSAKKRVHKSNDDSVIEKIWDCIRNNNGIMVNFINNVVLFLSTIIIFFVAY